MFLEKNIRKNHLEELFLPFKDKIDLNSIITVNPMVNIEIQKNKDSTVYYVDASGVKKEDIEIIVEKNILSFSYVRKSLKDEKVKLFSCSKSYKIDKDEIDIENIKSVLKEGVLIITLPYKEERKNKISINVE